MRTTYCGHASFRMEHAGVSVLVDPWFSPTGAFLGSWVQFPDNSHLDLDALRRSDVVLISHDHQDHFDLAFLRTLDPSTTIVVPRFHDGSLADVLRQELPNPVRTLEDRVSVELGGGIRVTPVIQSVPIWDDCAFVIESPTGTLFDLNDSKIPEADLDWVRERFDIDCVMLQYSGANWHPYAYTYEPAKKRRLARRKVLTKYRHVANIVGALDPAVVVPCAGPPCFLDDELFELNFSDESIFVGVDDFHRFASAEGFADRLRIVLPGDELLLDDRGRTLTVRNLEAPPFTDRAAYLEAYRKRRAPAIAEHLAAIPEPPGPLLDRFVDHFTPLVQGNPWLADRIGGRLLIETDRPWPEQVLLDFLRPDEPVRPYRGEPWSYRLRTDPRFLNEVLDGRLRWEELLLSMRIELTRQPDAYNEALVVFLRFADLEQYAVFESYERRRLEDDCFALDVDGQRFMVQRTCPHAGGDISKGHVEGDCVVCPVHGWRYSIRDGSSSTHPGYSISVTEVSLEPATT